MSVNELKKDEKAVIERLLELEREVALRGRKNVLSYYNTGEKIHEKQLAFHKCPLRNRWVFGGNRSGKTECGAVEAIWLLRGIHPYRKNKRNVTGWVVSPTYEVQREVAQSKILFYINPDWIEKITMQEGSSQYPETGIIDTLYIKNVFGGISKLGFKSCQQGREKFQGASLDFVWFDEEPPFEIYEECRMRVLDKVGDVFGTMTPLKGLTWVYDEIYLNASHDAETWYEMMEWADNPFLDAEEVARLSSSMSDETRESRRYGRFSASEGLVYTEFDPDVHVVEPFNIPEEFQAGISIDPGLHNPLSCHFYAIDYDGKVYVVAEHYAKNLTIKEHADMIKKIADSLNWKRDASGNLNAIIDAAASQKSLNGPKSVAELFFEQGIAVDTKVDKDLFAGIATVKEYLRARPARIVIFKNCVNLIREIKSYWWGKGDTPVKKDDHALDELRYFLMKHPITPKKAVGKKSPHLMYKEMLLRRHAVYKNNLKKMN